MYCIDKVTMFISGLSLPFLNFQSTVEPKIPVLQCLLKNRKRSRSSQNIYITGRQSAGNQRHESSLVETSETTRVASYSKYFCEWLAGLIDGDGCLLVSKKGYTSLEITMGLEDLPCLRYVQNKLGGSIKMRSGAKAYRYRLHNKQSMVTLIHCINGYIRHTSRLQQLHRVCQQLSISVIYPKLLDKESSWFAGFFDAKGMLNYKILDNNTKPLLYVNVIHRIYNLVTLFKDVFGGYIKMDFGGNGRYVWYLESEDQLLKFFEYVKTHTLRSSKRNKFFLVPEFYKIIDLEAYSKSKDILLKKVWVNFNKKFNRSLHTNNIHYRNLTNLDNNKKLDISSSNNLVVWGSSMGSGLSYGKITNQVSKLYEFNNYQYSVVIGLLLSDGWIKYSKGGKNPRLGFKQSLKKFNYFFSTFIVLLPFCNSLPSLITNRRNNKINYSLNIFTRSLPCIKNLHLLFYCNNKKIIPEDIYILLTPVALAHWIMGDGQKRESGLVLCTDSFTLPEVVLLVNVLITRYNFTCSIRTNNPGQYRIYISNKSMDSLRKIVSPYIDDSMLYKVNSMKDVKYK
jgi:LAGLIDADG DNA endonuclease family/LAGLIDADG endonuclease